VTGGAREGIEPPPRAWEALSHQLLSADDGAQRGAHRPLLTVGDRCGPMLRHIGGTAGENEPGGGCRQSSPAWATVRSVLGDYLRRWQAPEGPQGSPILRTVITDGWRRDTARSGHGLAGERQRDNARGLVPVATGYASTNLVPIGGRRGGQPPALLYLPLCNGSCPSLAVPASALRAH